jgi:hypothetical protein
MNKLKYLDKDTHVDTARVDASLAAGEKGALVPVTLFHARGTQIGR